MIFLTGEYKKTKAGYKVTAYSELSDAIEASTSDGNISGIVGYYSAEELAIAVAKALEASKIRNFQTIHQN